MKNFDPKRKTILIVEDNKDLQNTLVKFFHKAGYNTVTSDNGSDALIRCSKQQFDGILCDITMPKLSGDEAIMRIKNSDENSDTPIVVLSGYLDKDVVVRLKGKVNKAFTKPPIMNEVIDYFLMNIPPLKD